MFVPMSKSTLKYRLSIIGGALRDEGFVTDGQRYF